MIILNKYKVTDIKKFKRFMFMSILLISILAFTSMTTLNAYSKDIPKFDHIKVVEGDTLWSIASDYDDNKDIRKTIYEISKLNNIHNASIYPGDIIKIPIEFK
jgi:LysM repeat protein